MFLKVLKYSFSMLLMSSFLSCIENDIPYPYIEGVIKEFEVEGMIGEPVINSQTRTIDIVVGEDVFIDSLPVTKLVTNVESQIYPDSNACIKVNAFPNFGFNSSDELPANANTAMDFTNRVHFLLRTYQDYNWYVNVKQEIERVIEVENQSGTPPLIDAYNHVAIIYVTEDADYKNIKINKLNLEGNSTVLVPDFTEVVDFTRPRTFQAYRNGRYICDWVVDVQKSSVPAAIDKINPWATKVYVSGSFTSGRTPSLEYRKTGEEAWIKLEDSDLSVSNTTFQATIQGLEDGTAYELRASANDQPGEIVSFQTETIIEIPNMNFDSWTQSGKNWFPNADASDSYWATGNTGVTTVKPATTVPVEGSEAYKGKAAKMTTVTGVVLVGSAAGNLFIGTYKTNMTNPSASVSFGRDYNGARPTKLKGFYKYDSQPISAGSIPGNLQNDQCHIYMRLWSESGQEIAYGEFVGSESVTQYTPFEFELKYSDTESKPAKMTIVATSSRYGGDFEGSKVVGQVGNGSTLWVDEFELSYE